MINYFIIPGLGGSGEDHWQTFFEKTQKNFIRIEQENWLKPNIDKWIETIETSLSIVNPESVILVAHSLGCLTVAEWAKRYNRKIKGILLVAPPDVQLLHKELKYQVFENVPLQKINTKTILVASTNDHWATIELSASYAKKWGSEFVNIGNAGHINNLSGYGEWKEGLEILKRLS